MKLQFGKIPAPKSAPPMFLMILRVSWKPHLVNGRLSLRFWWLCVFQQHFTFCWTSTPLYSPCGFLHCLRYWWTSANLMFVAFLLILNNLQWFPCGFTCLHLLSPLFWPSYTFCIIHIFHDFARLSSVWIKRLLNTTPDTIKRDVLWRSGEWRVGIFPDYNREMPNVIWN